MYILVHWLDTGTQLLNFDVYSSVSHCMYAAHLPAPTIKLNGGDHVRHFQGFPYVDIGAEATVTLADGSTMPVPVKVVLNPLPPHCETIGLYEIEYEAFSPGPDGTPSGGKRATAQRIVEIGRYSLVISLLCIFKLVLGLLTGY